MMALEEELQMALEQVGSADLLLAACSLLLAPCCVLVANSQVVSLLIRNNLLPSGGRGWQRGYPGLIGDDHGCNVGYGYGGDGSGGGYGADLDWDGGWAERRGLKGVSALIATCYLLLAASNS